MATIDAASPDLSDLTDVGLEEIAGECDVAACRAARGGLYDAAEQLKEAARIVRAWADGGVRSV